MRKAPGWWSHTVELWFEIADYFFNSNVFDSNISDGTLWQRLSLGQSNYSYKLCLPEGAFFVQIVNTSNLDLLPQPEHRVSQFGLVQLINIEPWLVECYVDSAHVKISKWFLDTKSSKLSFDDDDFIVRLVEFLVALHSVDKNRIDATTLPSLNIRSHLRNYFEKVAVLELSDKPQFPFDLNACLKISASFEASAICHNDLSWPNLLWDQRELKVIDWEYACIGDPLFDLAGLIINCQLNRSQESKLIELYSTKLNKPVPLAKLSDMKDLYRTSSALWSVLYKNV